MKDRNSHLQQATIYCNKHGIKLTALRQTILALICHSPKPLGAYDILRELRKSRHRAEPPTVYRVLEFLLSSHLIHRIESNNTYINCIQPEASHHSQLLICKSCGNTLEIADQSLYKAIKCFVNTYKFKLADDLTEIRGLCEQCH